MFLHGDQSVLGITKPAFFQHPKHSSGTQEFLDLLISFLQPDQLWELINVTVGFQRLKSFKHFLVTMSWATQKFLSKPHFNVVSLFQMWRSQFLFNSYQFKWVRRPVSQHSQVSWGSLWMCPQEHHHNKEASPCLVPAGRQWSTLGVKNTWPTWGIRTWTNQFRIITIREHHRARDQDTHHHSHWNHSNHQLRDHQPEQHSDHGEQHWEEERIPADADPGPVWRWLWQRGLWGWVHTRDQYWDC